MCLLGRHIEIKWKKWNPKFTLFFVHWWLFHLIVAGNLTISSLRNIPFIDFVIWEKKNEFFFNFLVVCGGDCASRKNEMKILRNVMVWLRPRRFEINHSSCLVHRDIQCRRYQYMWRPGQIAIFYLLYFEALPCYYVIVLRVQCTSKCVSFIALPRTEKKIIWNIWTA